MEHFWMSSLLILLVTCYVGNSEAAVKINVPETILSGQLTSGICVASGTQYTPLYLQGYLRVRVRVVDDNNSNGGCIINHTGSLQNIKPAHYQQNFSIICNGSNNYSVSIECFTTINDDTTQIQIQVIKPKIINSFLTGLPITLRCTVEGDPNHIWIGWLNRNTIIQLGEEHSTSTAPNFQPGSNSTTHYLTIHSIKVPGGYECKMYAITGEIQDQVSHQVLVAEESREQITLPSSSLSSSLLNYITSACY